jgi:hypothetical protein
MARAERFLGVYNRVENHLRKPVQAGIGTGSTAIYAR